MALNIPNAVQERVVPWLLSTSVLLVIAVSAYTVWYKGNYEFIVEASCDPTVKSCHYRDCTDPDACPPNGLEYYTIYSISAGDFDICTSNSCAVECASGAIACTEFACGESEEDVCEYTPPEEEVQNDTEATTLDVEGGL